MSDAEPKVPIWKNPYLIGFLIGAAFLTLLRPMAEQFRRAPPPIRQLTAWEVPSLGGGPVSLSALSGKVVLLTTELGPCDSACVDRQKTFGLATRHVDDFGDRVVLVSLVGEGAQDALTPLAQTATPAWRFAGGTAAELQPILSQLQLALDQMERSPSFPLAPGADFSRSHTIALLDQNGAVRAFWMDDGAGRGNSINGARLLAEKGPNP